MLVENSVMCKDCFDTISSNTPYEKTKCSCGNVLLFGGLENPTVIGDAFSLKWYLDDDVVNKCIAAIGGATERKEVVLSVLRSLRASERVIADGEPIFVAERENEVMFRKDDEYIICQKTGENNGTP